jgi:hypothetical protein
MGASSCHFGNLDDHLAAVGSIVEVNWHSGGAPPLAEDAETRRERLSGRMCYPPGPISRCLNLWRAQSLRRKQHQMSRYTHELLSVAMPQASYQTCCPSFDPGCLGMQKSRVPTFKWAGHPGCSMALSTSFLVSSTIFCLDLWSRSRCFFTLPWLWVLIRVLSELFALFLQSSYESF